MKIFSYKKNLIILLLLAASAKINAQNCDNIKESTPTSRFTLNGSEVKDNITGLIWQRCSIGQKWNSFIKTCDGSAKQLNWKQALEETKKIATGYRLPNIKELNSIVENKCNNAAINQEVFPNTPSNFFWTSSVSQNLEQNAWSIHFYQGDTYNSHTKTNLHYVRAVRFDQPSQGQN